MINTKRPDHDDKEAEHDEDDDDDDERDCDEDLLEFVMALLFKERQSVVSKVEKNDCSLGFMEYNCCEQRETQLRGFQRVIRKKRRSSEMKKSNLVERARGTLYDTLCFFARLYFSGFRWRFSFHDAYVEILNYGVLKM